MSGTDQISIHSARSGYQANRPKEVSQIFFQKIALIKTEAMLKLNDSKEINPIGTRAMDTVAPCCQESSSFLIVCDERCSVVHNLSMLLKLWDRKNIFTFVDLNSKSPSARSLVDDLERSPWSLILIDEFENRWSGPEAIPIILKHLPFGKVAAVLYILPGTMWITRQLYMLVSRNRRRFSTSSQTA